MSDDQDFPTLKIFKELEEVLYSENQNIVGRLKGFSKSLNAALDAIGFTDSYTQEQVKNFAKEKIKASEVEDRASTVSKVIKDLIWDMVELDEATVSLLDTPLVQRLRFIKQNGFTYLVYPPATHARFEHSLGVFAVASQYIASINESANKPNRFGKGLIPKSIAPKLALDIKHAAMLHDIGHLPFSHVLESIYEADPQAFKVGSASVRDFETCFMKKLRDSKSHLSERLSIALVLSPRFKKFYSALRRDKWAYLRVACLISGASLHENMPGYSQFISGAVDCDKVDYLLRDSRMCNVPVAIDKARLFLNSALIECNKQATIKKLNDRGVTNLASVVLENPALILVLNTSGVDTIEEVAFARATMYERVYRHAVTRNAERILSVAISSAAAENSSWNNVLYTYPLTDDTLLALLDKSKSERHLRLASRLRRRSIPKRAFAFSPDFYTPVVPYVSIFSGISDDDAESQYYHEVISKDPFHTVVEGLKERSAIFLSSEKHRELEESIATRATQIRSKLRNSGQSNLPTGHAPEVFFIPLPDHSSTPTSCAIVTREGELESSGDYSRAPQLVSAKEIGRSAGFVTCETSWAEIIFLAAQEILYEYFGNEVIQIDLPLDFDTKALLETKPSNDLAAAKTVRTINVGAVKRFYVPEQMASRRCRLNRTRLSSHRLVLSQNGFYDRRPRLATPIRHTNDLTKIGAKFKDFSGQHSWHVTDESLRQFLNQFPPRLREDAKRLLQSINFLNRRRTGELLKVAVENVLNGLDGRPNGRSIHVVPLAGTSAHVSMELLNQEFRADLKRNSLLLSHSIHELLGTARRGDAVIFIDDNIGSGTQFSAQMLRWSKGLNASHSKHIRAEKGIELTPLDKNRIELFEGLEIWLATCVGRAESEDNVKKNLQGSRINFCGLRSGENLSAGNQSTGKRTPFVEFLGLIGAECIRHCRGLQTITKECKDNSLGYANTEGLTVTLWNVPTSTYTALWSPAVIDGEPWCPLFIRRGYVEHLVIA